MRVRISVSTFGGRWEGTIIGRPSRGAMQNRALYYVPENYDGCLVWVWESLAPTMR